MFNLLTLLSVAVLGGATPTPTQNTPVSVEICHEVQSREIETAQAKKSVSQKQVLATTDQPKQPILAPADAEALINKYAAQYGADPNLMKKIARCESRFNPNATNGQYSGMYQFGNSTWISTRKQMGLDTNVALRFSAEEAIKTAAFKLASGGQMAWKACL